MNIKKGTGRIVLLLPSLGIAVKLPYIRLISFCLDTWRNFRRGTLIQTWTWSIRVFGSPKHMLFMGIVDNWLEYRFWRRPKHRFAAPSLFSLFGLINIQCIGDPCVVKTVNHWCQLYEITDGMVFNDCHHFGNPKNFGISKKEIRILDYSSPRVQEVIEKYGTLIVEQYDFTYDWKEVKEQRTAEPPISH